MKLTTVVRVVLCKKLRARLKSSKTNNNPSFFAQLIEPWILVWVIGLNAEVLVFPLADVVCRTTTSQNQRTGREYERDGFFHSLVDI